MTIISVDRSSSKTAETILKAVALFGVALLAIDRVKLHVQCAKNIDWMAVFGVSTISIALFLLGIMVLMERLLELYPWIFLGPEWWGKLSYAILTVILLIFVQPVSTLLLRNPIATDDLLSVCQQKNAPTDPDASLK